MAIRKFGSSPDWRKPLGPPRRSRKPEIPLHKCNFLATHSWLVFGWVLMLCYDLRISSYLESGLLLELDGIFVCRIEAT